MKKAELIEAIQGLDPEFKLSGEERTHELEVILRGLEAPAQLEEAEETIEELNKQLANAEVKAKSKGGHELVGEVEQGKVFMTIPRARLRDSEGVKHLITPEVLRGNENLLTEALAQNPSYLVIK